MVVVERHNSQLVSPSSFNRTSVKKWANFSYQDNYQTDNMAQAYLHFEPLYTIVHSILDHDNLLYPTTKQIQYTIPQLQINTYKYITTIPNQ